MIQKFPKWHQEPCSSMVLPGVSNGDVQGQIPLSHSKMYKKECDNWTTGACLDTFTQKLITCREKKKNKDENDISIK